MKTITKILLILGLAVSSTSENCWWMGCPKVPWQFEGCAGWDMDERGTRLCEPINGGTGVQFYCCEKDRKFVSYERFSDAVTKNGGPAPSRDVFNNFNTYARAYGNIEDTQEAAMALAQCIHESDGLVAKREYACEHTQCPNSYRNSSCDRPGQFYYGRGYIKLTWCYNYGAASQKIFGNDWLLKNPDHVATYDHIAWETSFWFWGKRVHGQNGVAQGQFGVTTRMINGGIECGTGSSTPQKRFQIYEIVREAFGLQGAGDPSGC